MNIQLFSLISLKVILTVEYSESVFGIDSIYIYIYIYIYMKVKVLVT